MVAELMSDALEALEAAPVEDDARSVLRELAFAATSRSV
jgi:hypothetical protein